MDTRGVTVTFLRTFVHDNQAKLEGMTTTDVCNQMIKPQTECWGISYLELLERRGDISSFGQATHFASHAWSYSFLSFVGTIFQKCEDDGLDEDATRPWIDIFSVNQHLGIERFDHWAVSFKVAIRVIGKALLIFIPYRGAVWLERAWCLFELWAIVEGQVPFEIVLPAEEKKSFTTFLVEGGKVEDVISEIDIRKARAYKPSDLENINRIVDKSMGHGRLNELLTAEMRKWFVSTAESALLMIPEENRTVSELYLNIMKMYRMLGRYSDAETGLVVRCNNQQELLGTNDIKLAETMCELGGSKLDLGQLDSAIAVLSEALLISRMPELENLELLGKITNALGRVKSDQGKYSEALQMYQESLDLRTRCFGTGHVSVADTYNNMGVVYETQGDYEKALFHYQNALDIKIKSLGGAHASVATTEMNIGNVLSAQGDYENALLHLQKALDINVKCLGPSHVSVAQTHGNISNVLSAQGDDENSLFHAQKALEIFEISLGPLHVNVGMANDGLGILLLKKGDYENALFRHKKALEIKARCLGTGHVAVADTKNNMAIVYGNLGNQAKRLQLIREVHAIYMQALGPDHPKTQGITPFI